MSLELSGTTPAIKGVAGSVSAPALTGDDVDTGISFPSANTIKFSTGGVERMSITDSGVTGAGGKFASYALICDSKGNTTDGGTFTSGAWRTRDLNQEISDEDSIVSISSNQFTLAAGSYLIKWKCPAMKVDHHVTKLILITGSVSSFTEKAGSSSYAADNAVVQNESFGVARVTLTGSGAFEIQHRCDVTKTTDGFGQPANGYASESIYTIVEIFKES